MRDDNKKRTDPFLEIRARSKMKTINRKTLRLIFLGILIFELIGASQSLTAKTTVDSSKENPIKSMLVTNASGNFRLEIWTIGNSKDEFQLVIYSTGTNVNQSVTIRDEASSISNFLDQLTQQHFPVRRIKSLYIPAMKEIEIKKS